MAPLYHRDYILDYTGTPPMPYWCPALIEAAALAVHLENVDVVGEAVEQRPGEALGAEHLGPLVERQVGR